MSTWKCEYTHPTTFPRHPIEVKLQHALQGPAKLMLTDIEDSICFDEHRDCPDMPFIDSDSDVDSDEDCNVRVSKKSDKHAESTVAGAFRKHMFAKYVEDISSKKCLNLTAEKIAQLRSTCILTQHAEERKSERYSKRMQEFLRSLATTNDCLAVKSPRYYLLLDSKIIEISSSYDVIHVNENQPDVIGSRYRQTKPLNLSAMRRLTGMYDD